MKNLLPLILLIIFRPINSFSEVVPCNKPKCDKKEHFILKNLENQK